MAVELRLNGKSVGTQTLHSTGTGAAVFLVPAGKLPAGETEAQLQAFAYDRYFSPIVTSRGVRTPTGNHVAAESNIVRLKHTLTLREKLKEALRPYSTLKEVEDEDGDGLLNGFEIVSLRLSTIPTHPDTDEDGTRDGEEDSDDDGLSNLEEQTANTDPLLDDTDGDRITDNEEITNQHTNALSNDTDNDGLSDGLEVELGSNPILADTDGDGTVDGDEAFRFSVRGEEGDVSIEVEGNGRLKRSLVITSAETASSLEGAPSYFSPIEILSPTDEAFSEATISIAYDPAQFGDTNPNDLQIVHFDKSRGTVEPLADQIVDTDTHTVSGKTTHFSTFMLIDRNKWVAAFSNEFFGSIKAGANGFDIVFAIDISGSMGGVIGEVKLKAIEIMNDLQVRMGAPDRAQFGVVSFSDYPGSFSYPGYSATYGHPASGDGGGGGDGGGCSVCLMGSPVASQSQVNSAYRIDQSSPSDINAFATAVGDTPYRIDKVITSDISEVATAINELALLFGGDGPEAYTRVLYDLQDDVTNPGWRLGTTKVVIMFGDAPTHDLHFAGYNFGGDPGRDNVPQTEDDLDFETVVKQLQTKGITVFAIDSGNTAESEATLKGMSIGFAESVGTGGRYFSIDQAAEIVRVLEKIIIETKDADGDGLSDEAETKGMRTGTGLIVFSNPDVSDTDGDGIADGEEMGNIRSGVFGLYYQMTSNPTKADSDLDGLSDSNEKSKGTNPMKSDSDNDALSDKVDSNPNWWDFYGRFRRGDVITVGHSPEAEKEWGTLEKIAMGTWSHAGIYLGDEIVIESHPANFTGNPTGGVGTTTISTFLVNEQEGSSREGYYRFAGLRVKDKADDISANAGDEALTYYGKPFGMGLDDALFGFFPFVGDLYCAELVERSWSAQGISFKKLYLPWVTPKDIHDGKSVEVIDERLN